MVRTLRNSSFSWVLTLLVALASAPALVAQETTGAVDGVVRDSSGGVLPGTTVTVAGPVGTLTTVTDAAGGFRFPRLPPGRYIVRTSLSGFIPGEQTIDLSVGTTRSVEFRLSVSGIAEAI